MVGMRAIMSKSRISTIPTVVLLVLLAVLATGPARGLAQPADRVVLVSVDGLRADLLVSLMANDLVGDYANFRRVVDEGAATFNARTDYTHTVTLPNHTCMLTGRPVLQPAGQPFIVHHGYTSNTDPGPEDTLHNSGNPYVSYIAGAFDVAHDAGLSTALYASKSKFVIFDQSWDSIDTYHQASTGSPANASNMHTVMLADLIADPADLIFIHYRDPDSAGHASGWGSTAWNQSVSNVDGYLGDIFALIDAGKMGGNVALIVTSDHGGSGTGHSDAGNPYNYTIPFLAWGSGVAPGQDLYALNAGTRTDPGLGRPDYSATGQPIRNGDSGNLALGLLGLGAIPGSTINDAQDLAVGSPLSVALEIPRRGFGLAVHPNPFNPSTNIRFTLERTSRTTVDVYDTRGRRVRRLMDQDLAAGQHDASWNGRDDHGRSLPSGTYLALVRSGGVLETRKMALVE